MVDITNLNLSDEELKELLKKIDDGSIEIDIEQLVEILKKSDKIDVKV